MNLAQALSILSKSSPYAVSTDNKNLHSTELDEIKKYLYIDTDIEKEFVRELKRLSYGKKTLIFLCGSSGDGKSEILTKYKAEFTARADFHLDATHSFRPGDSAIQTLNEKFSEFDLGSRSLVVGINTGMLGNYREEGSNADIVASIRHFLDKEYDSIPENHVYLDFEDYPKFSMEVDGHTSKFAKQLFQKITASDDKNLIRVFYDRETQSASPDRRLCVNYALLAIDEVQDVIIDILFKVRLKRDQFLTARSLLDFIHHLLTGPRYLFDNLFSGGENELTRKITELDPVNSRTKDIDKFILAQSLKLPDSEFEQFQNDAKVRFGIRRDTKPHSYLRLFYLIRKLDFSNNYHRTFTKDFSEDLISRYSELWHLHSGYDGTPEQKEVLRTFYRHTAIAAIHKYNNRNASFLEKDKFFISNHNDYLLASEVELTADIKSIQADKNKNSSHFNAYFKVGDKRISIPTNINLLDLMQRIVSGYRPNKHDKNTVVLLDELVDEISMIASKSNVLYVLNKSGQKYKIKNIDDDFEVSRT